MDNQEHRIIQNSQPQSGKLAPNIPNPLVGDIKFKNDFGETPVGLAHFTKDQGAIAILSLAGAFVGAALGGLPAAGVILLAMMNDIKYAGRAEAPLKAPDDVIDVPSQAIEDAHSSTPAQEPVASKSVASKEQSADYTPVTPLPIQSSTTNHKWIDNFIRQTALIWGNQGSGKSWIARYVAKRKKDEGYRVIVLDPDSNRAEWQGVESYHDFEEIAEFLSWYVEELKGRYKAFNASSMTEDAWRAKLWADSKAIAVLCEEVTTYVDLIEDKELLTQFFRLGLTKSRKQEMPLTLVSHNNTQSALGGIKGLANLIDKMLQLELKTDIDPETLQPTASGKGAVKLRSR